MFTDDEIRKLIEEIVPATQAEVDAIEAEYQKSLKRRYFVIAWNWQQFRNWCYEQKIDYHKQKYCYRFDDVLGIDPDGWEFVWLDTPRHLYEYANDIREYLCERKIKAGPGSKWGCEMRGV